MYSKTRTIILILLASSIFLAVVGPRPGKAQPLQQHAPIFIVRQGGVENFTSPTCPLPCMSSGVRSGSGTSQNPYVISDWNITIIDNTAAGIHIQNTLSFFIIRNVVIHRTSFALNTQGIFLDNLQNGKIENVDVSNFYDGVWLSLGSTSTVNASRIWHNSYGLYMTGINDLATGNHLYNNTIYGAYVTNQYNTLTGNNASANGTPPCGSSCSSDGAGIFVSASNNIFENNTLSDNTWFGIKLVASSYNTIRNNTVARDGIGAGIVLVDGSNRNLVIGNYVTEQLNALGLENTENTTALQNNYNNITGNRIVGNTQGVYLYNSPLNWIYNNILNNTTNAVDNSLQNSWNITRQLGTNILGGPLIGGNLYGNFDTPSQGCNDTNGDGFCDSPYSVTGGFNGQFAQDLLPLSLNQPGAIHDISVQGVTVQPTTARVGANIIISVKVSNLGTVAEPFTLTTTYAPQTLPQPQIISSVPVSLAANSAKTIAITWNTAGLAVGAYFVQANASIVTGETNTADNACCTPPATETLSINKPPVALFTTSNMTSLAGRPITVNATQSYDPDGTISSYVWNFGDGATGTGSIMSHAWSLAGNYTISLTVTDNEGGTDSTVASVMVIYHQPGPPVNIQLSATSGHATLNWTAPNDNGGSPIIKYRIYRGLSNETFGWIANTTGLTYVDAAVASGQTYYYKVTAVNQAGLESPISQSVPENVLIPAPAPSPPNNFPILIAIAGGVGVLAVAIAVIIFRRRGRLGRAPT